MLHVNRLGGAVRELGRRQEADVHLVVDQRMLVQRSRPIQTHHEHHHDDQEDGEGGTNAHRDLLSRAGRRAKTVPFIGGRLLACRTTAMLQGLDLVAQDAVYFGVVRVKVRIPDNNWRGCVIQFVTIMTTGMTLVFFGAAAAAVAACRWSRDCGHRCPAHHKHCTARVQCQGEGASHRIGYL